MLPDVSRESFARETGIENVSRESLDKLTHYLVMLEKWQKAVNIVSPATIPDAWRRHFLDSAQLGPMFDIGEIVSARQRRVGSSPVCYAGEDVADKVTLFDFGSGGGFPGLVLAMLYPALLSVHLVESDQKKCSFMAAVSRETNTGVSIHNVRIEALETDAVPDVISARALADLDLLLKYAAPWAQKNPDLVLVLPKGEKYTSELEKAGDQRFAQCEEFPSKTDKNARILRISGLK